MFRAISEVRTKDREYSNFAINIYKGCNHSCTYCQSKYKYNPDHTILPTMVQDGIVDIVRQQFSFGDHKNDKVLLCFTCDPYPKDIDTEPTREIIKIIKGSGASISILTKGASRSERDFELLDFNDSFGVSISCDEQFSHIYEPNADSPSDRLYYLTKAKSMGIKTWVSCEPVLQVDAIYKLITDYGNIIDLYRIGKLNYYPSDINWKEFGRKCEHLCKKYNRNYYIKEDLRMLMS